MKCIYIYIYIYISIMDGHISNSYWLTWFYIITIRFPSSFDVVLFYLA